MPTLEQAKPINLPRTEPLSRKELASALRRSPGYVSAMKKAGFSMPGNRASVTEAEEWLRSNKDFRFDAVYRSGKHD